MRLIAVALLLAGCSAHQDIGPDPQNDPVDAQAPDAPAQEPDSAPPTPDAATPTPEASGPGAGDAGADAGPVAVTEQCSQSFSSGGATYLYAEHNFPGMPANQLASTVAVGAIHVGGTVVAPSAYTSAVGFQLLVRDGYVALVCGSGPNIAYDSVTFTLKP